MKYIGLIALMISVGCSDRFLVRNATAAYQYQKGVYQHTCDLPPKSQTSACVTRDKELTEDYFQIDTSINAIERSQGGKLPKVARTKLKQIRKELDK